MSTIEFKDMVGKTIKEIKGGVGGEEMVSVADDGTKFVFYHSSDCCESVNINDIVGDLADLIGSPIVKAEENSSKDPPAERSYPPESFTWTFYNFVTAKGAVTVKWFGESNGYYSESVAFEAIPPSKGDEDA